MLTAEQFCKYNFGHVTKTNIHVHVVFKRIIQAVLTKKRVQIKCSTDYEKLVFIMSIFS